MHDVDLSRSRAHSVGVPPAKDPSRQVAFRLSEDLLNRIDRYQAKLATELPAGIDVTQANAVRVLLDKALAAEGFPASKGRGRGAKGK